MTLADPTPSQNTPAAASTERREAVRRRARGEIDLTSESGDVVRCELIDISESGVRVKITSDLSALNSGQHVLLTLVHEGIDDPPQRDGVVVWSGGDSTNASMGITLTDGVSVALEAVDIDRVKVDVPLALRLDASRASRWQVLPFACDEDRVMVAAAALPQPRVFSALQRLYGLTPELHFAEPDRLDAALDRIYSGVADTPSYAGDRGASIDRGASLDRGLSIDIDASAGGEDDAITLCDRLLTAAVVQNASDVHIDSYEEQVRIRFRVDGQIESFREVMPDVGAALISRIKVLAGLDIAERRAPQDGRMRHEHGSMAIDIRVASLPTKQGERLTLRLLARDTELLTLPALGMNEQQLAYFNEAIRKPHGLILITGPTGSGKSTTLYAAIRQLLMESPQNIITIEDPVEYQIDGITQVEVDQKEKVTFAKALRSTLRHDPDVVMVGEIRDAETADIAVKAALTGHLVFSTLHTNDAPGAITRLRDMDVPLYLVGATLRLVMAQRLVRRLCNRCSETVTCTSAQAMALGRSDLEGKPIQQAVGCMYCGGRGYTGRMGLFETLPCDAELAQRITQGDVGQIYRDLNEDGIEKLLAGQTSIDELMRHVVSAV